MKKYWKNKNVLVTGATGIVGCWLSSELAEAGANVIALVRDMDPQSEFFRSGVYKKVVIINGSLEDYFTLERAINDHEVDTVFHLAAQALVTVAYRSPLTTLESNIRGTYNILEACRRLAPLVKRIVVASSDKAYGSSEKLPYTEDMALRGSNPYDVSKSCADLITSSYANTYELPAAIARCGNIYGGGDLNWDRIIPGTIRSVYQGENPVIRSDGSYIRDYIYVLDAVRGYMCLAQSLEEKSLAGEAFNFSSGTRISALELVENILTIMDVGKLKPEILNHAKAEIREQWLSSEKAANILGWNAETGIEVGLEETIGWYSKYLAGRAD